MSNPYDVYAGKTFLFPSQFTLDGYKAVFADDGILAGYVNSIKYTVIGTAFSVIMIYVTAYSLSKRDLPDAFLGVNLTNYELAVYGDDGTFIDLTPYLTEEYMPNLTRILDENPDIRSAITMSTGFDEWCWGQNIFYAGFGFTNWPNDVCKDLTLRPDGTCEFVCAKDQYREAV